MSSTGEDLDCRLYIRFNGLMDTCDSWVISLTPAANFSFVNLNCNSTQLKLVDANEIYHDIQLANTLFR